MSRRSTARSMTNGCTRVWLASTIIHVPKTETTFLCLRNATISAWEGASRANGI